MSDNNKQIAIKLSGVKKMYRLGQIGGGTLQNDLQSWWARVRGKEDPNTKIGQGQRLVGQTLMALNDIDLTVYHGEALGVIGANGAGKSTLLKLLSRVTAPSDGEIDIYGRVTSMLEVGTGFNGEMTGRENIYMNGAILGMSKAEIDAKMEDIIDFSEVREFIDTPVKRYSSGMYVKLAFSVAAHLDSEIMIMDEVLAVGDMAFQKKCLAKMDDVSSRQGKTILYVSHNMSTIRQFCTRVIVLKEGRIIFDGDVNEGIAVYMDQSVDTSHVEFDLSNKYQKYLSPYPKAKMMKARFINKECAVFDYQEPIDFELQIFARMPVNKLSLRFEIRAADGSSVGTAFAFDRFSIEEGETKSFIVSFNSNGLIAGKYSVVLGLFEKNEYGSYTDIDVIERALNFGIKDNNGQIGIQWLRQYWGYVKFIDLHIESI